MSWRNSQSISSNAIGNPEEPIAKGAHRTVDMIRGAISPGFDTLSPRGQWAAETLGPILFDFIDRLHGALTIQAANGPVQTLFCTRAGFRLLHLYRLYCGLVGTEPIGTPELLAISRLLAAKGCFPLFPDLTVDLLHREFRSYSTSQAIPRLLATEHIEHVDIEDIKKHFRSVWDSGLTRDSLDNLIYGTQPASVLLKQCYMDEGARYNAYLDTMMPRDGTSILIDTGWVGTQQRLLMSARPQQSIVGFLFGRMNAPPTEAWHYRHMRGLVFEAGGYYPDVKPSVITSYRHLIEDVLEPPIPSFGHTSDIARLEDSKLELEVRGRNDDHFEGVLAWFEHAATRSRLDLYRQLSAAWGNLEQVVLSPSAHQVRLAATRSRSADFGKTEANPVVFLPENHPNLSRVERERRALWPEGQRALESAAADSSLKDSAPPPLVSLRERKPEGSVAIITRTKDRPVLLERAAKSIAEQTYSNFQWIVVNDAGDRHVVEEVIRRSSVDLRKVRIIHRSASIGMEAASNAAIAHSDLSDYVIIHDDDDTWQPQFLEKTVAWLDNPPTLHHRAVVTSATRISECVIDKSYSEIVDRRPYNDTPPTIEFQHLINENTFPPIAFLFSRSLYEEIGGFNENLPVLGDWDFNLSVLARSEIGVLPEPLANYFHRDLQAFSPYSNSVIGAVDKHILFGTAFRNDTFRDQTLFLRDGISQALQGINLGPAIRELKHAFTATSNNSTGSVGPNIDTHGRGIETTEALFRMVANLTTMMQSAVISLAKLSRQAGGDLIDRTVVTGLPNSVERNAQFIYFSRSRINNTVNNADYAHLQIVMETVEIGQRPFEWLDFRICRDGSGPFFEIFNWGRNFEALEVPATESKSVRLYEGDRAVNNDSHHIEWNQQSTFRKAAFDALTRAENLGTEANDQSRLQWLEDAALLSC